VPLVDTNVLLALLTNDPIWADWSVRQLDKLSLQKKLIVKPVVYAELSVGFDRTEEVDAALAQVGIELIEIPRAALFLAGKAFAKYRARRDTRTGLLPDFFIGAHAVVEGTALLTRDNQRYRSYFPTLTLITPSDA
jgi:predicted nucleic acid-binding protein